MAGGAGLLDEGQEGVVVAIGSEGEHLLQVAAGSALVPQLLTGAAPKPGVAGFQGLLQAFPVHVGQHQHLAGALFLHNAGDKGGFGEVLFQVH